MTHVIRSLLTNLLGIAAADDNDDDDVTATAM